MGWPEAEPNRVMSGMITSQAKAPPANMIAAILGPRTKPTPRSAGEASPESWAPGKRGIFQAGVAGQSLRPEVRNSKTAPRPRPQKTVAARLRPPPAGPQTAAAAGA